MVGTNSSAMNSDAASVTSRVIGKYFINSPIRPGQNSSGMNTANVVAVDAVMGQAMRLDASVNANFGL